MKKDKLDKDFDLQGRVSKLKSKVLDVYYENIELKEEINKLRTEITDLETYLESLSSGYYIRR